MDQKTGTTQKKSNWYLWACGGCGCLILLIITAIVLYQVFRNIDGGGLEKSSGSVSKDEEDREMTKEELINYFIEETTMLANTPVNVSKWTKPTVSVSIEDTPPEGGVKAVDSFITVFNKNSTKTKMQRIEKGGDIRVYFQEETHGAAGTSGAHAGKDNIITLAIVVLSEKAGYIEQALSQITSHEMMHAVGFTGHYTGSTCRMMSPSTCGSHFTQNEEKLIEMLYSTDLPVGSNETEIRAYFNNN